jgi:hypothetical protein
MSLMSRSQCAVTMILLEMLTPDPCTQNLNIVKYSFNVALEDNEFENYEEHLNWKEFIADIIMHQTVLLYSTCYC